MLVNRIVATIGTLTLIVLALIVLVTMAAVASGIVVYLLSLIT